MAGENTFSTMNGLFKTVYAESLKDLVPDYALLQKKLSFIEDAKQTGNFYAQPVNLSHEAGFTYNGDAGTVVALNAAANAVMKEAQVKGSELILRSQIAYTALSRASEKGTKAFKKASSWKVEDMNNSMRKRLEIAMLYGQTGVATVSSFNTATVVITDATWAGGIWAGAEGAKIDIYQSNLSTLRTDAGDLTIASVNSDSKSITFSSISGTPVAGDVLFFKGSNSSGTFNEMAGIKKILTASSSIFNIDPSTYSLWNGNEVSSVGALTFGKLQDALAKAINKGLMEKVTVLVSPKAWASLNTDQAALRVFDSSYKSSKAENGAESLTFHSACGQVEILSHPMVKDGDAFILPMDSVLRLGSTDVTFGVPGMDEQFFTLVSGYNAVELQCFTDQALFIEKPAHCVYLSGITYS